MEVVLQKKYLRKVLAEVQEVLEHATCSSEARFLEHVPNLKDWDHRVRGNANQVVLEGHHQVGSEDVYQEEDRHLVDHQVDLALPTVADV